MDYQSMPFGKFKGTLLKDLPSNYIIHAVESFDLPNELKYSLKQIIGNRLGLISDKKEYLINLIDDGGVNTIYPEILPSVGSYFIHEYGIYKMTDSNSANRNFGHKYTELYERLVYLGFDPQINASGLLQLIDNLGGYFSYEDYEFKGKSMENFTIYKLVQSFSKSFYCEWVDKFTIQIAY